MSKVSSAFVIYNSILKAGCRKANKFYAVNIFYHEQSSFVAFNFAG